MSASIAAPASQSARSKPSTTRPQVPDDKRQWLQINADEAANSAGRNQKNRRAAPFAEERKLGCEQPNGRDRFRFSLGLRAARAAPPHRRSAARLLRATSRLLHVDRLC